MTLRDKSGRPRWWCLAVYGLAIFGLFALGVIVGALIGVNPYIAGTLCAGGGGLRVVYEVAREERRRSRVNGEFLATEPPSDGDVERAKAIARERGLLREDGTWIWDD